jgi:hypothetical protein
MGHWVRKCHSKPKKEQVHDVQDEEEVSLMLATTTLICPEAGGPTTPAREVRSPGESSIGTSAQGSAVKVISSSAEVEIHEEKVFTHLDQEKERDVGTWVMDTWAMNHLFGCRAVFMKINTIVLGTMHFRDDSVAWIEGRGTVVFICKNGESWSSDRVYFIRRD